MNLLVCLSEGLQGSGFRVGLKFGASISCLVLCLSEGLWGVGLGVGLRGALQSLSGLHVVCGHFGP